MSLTILAGDVLDIPLPHISDPDGDKFKIDIQLGEALMFMKEVKDKGLNRESTLILRAAPGKNHVRD